MSSVRKSFYILIPLLASLIAILLLEAGMALFYPIPFTLEKNMYFESDPYTGFRHKALGRGHYPNGIQANANSRGQRDEEVDIPKPDGVFRVVLVGDSFTVGANVEQEEAYPEVLETLLNELTDQPVEVVNTGTGGWGPFQYAQFYEHYGQAFEPDLVVVGFFVGNDTYIDRQHLNDTRSAVLGRRLPRDRGHNWAIKLRVLLYENSNIARALMTPGQQLMEFTREHCDEFPDYFIGVQTNRMPIHLANPGEEKLGLLAKNAEQIERIHSLAAANDVPMLVALFPDENQLNKALQAQIIPPEEVGQYDFEMPQRALEQQFAMYDIPYIDLKQAISDDPRCLFMNDTHWMPAGHQLVAEKIRDYLVGHGLVPVDTPAPVTTGAGS